MCEMATTRQCGSILIERVGDFTACGALKPGKFLHEDGGTGAPRARTQH
jgi:hypothetical protein